ncbi:hypothetical protein IKG10_02225 [Candidatus Saccharibacteria bacterium]|nr:hypothetical protein [Candidatus Saccharibacteria bacterium]
MTNKPKATDEEIRLQLVNELKSLHEKLGYTPDRFDWIIHTGRKWQPYFKSMPAFLAKGGMTSRPRSHYEKDKLCKALKAIEGRLGRTTRERDWHKQVVKNTGVWKFHFRISPSYSYAPIELRELISDYTEGVYPFYSDDKSDWLNFRYAAGLDRYSQEELIALGVKNLNAMQKYDHSLEKRLKLMDASEALQDVKIRDNFVKGLPHFAIHDQFETLREYFDVAAKHWLQGNPSTQEACVQVDQEAPNTHLANQSMDELISSLKSIATELEQRGWLVEINLRIN